MEIFVPITPSFSHLPNYWHRRPGRGCGMRGRGGCHRQHPMAPWRQFEGLDFMDWFYPKDKIDVILRCPAKQKVPEQNKSTGNAEPEKNESISQTENEVSSNIQPKNNNFEVKINVSNYKPEELNVKFSNGLITVEGKHEETKTDADGSEEIVSNQFKRSFHLPENAIEDSLESKLSSDGGMLIISAKIKAIEQSPEPTVKSIPIEISGSGNDQDSSVATPTHHPEEMTQAEKHAADTSPAA